jgi:hypothetical protein
MGQGNMKGLFAMGIAAAGTVIERGTSRTAKGAPVWQHLTSSKSGINGRGNPEAPSSPLALYAMGEEGGFESG